MQQTEAYKYAIIGNSAAGIGCVEGIREIDPDGTIAVISDEPYHTYSRPLISYYLAGKVDDARMDYRPRSFYEQMNVTPLLGDRVDRIHPAEQSVEFEDGRCLEYERLLVGTGGAPFVPKIEGLAPGAFHTFTTWDDAKRLKELLPNTKHAVVLGGGLIGIKAAEAIREAGVEVTIIELAETLMSRAIDDVAGEMFRDAAEEAKVRVRTGQTVAAARVADGQVAGVTLTDGTHLDCDQLIVAIGVVPNLACVKESTLEVGRGLVVDDRMATNDDKVFAAGDVVEGRNLLLGTKEPIPIWPSAYSQGKIAGHNMAGQNDTHLGSFAMNSVDINHFPVIAMGITRPPENEGYEVLVKHDRRQRVYRKIVLQDDVVVGAIFVNKIDRAGIVCGLIRDGINVANFKEALLDDHFGYLSLPPKLRRERLDTLGVKQC